MIKSILPLSSIIALRFLGLFLVLPVISVYAANLENSTTFMVGIVVGGYALTQMIFQVPFGMFSDRMGRKKTIVFGLILFALGSAVCAVSTDIYTLIIGRFLQGSGAIAAVVIAMISDIVKEEQRPKAMATMGMTIALSFAVSMIAGPTLGAYIGIEFLFWMTGIFALGSIVILLKAVPNPPKITHTYETKSKFSIILSDSNLIKMNITNFLQKGLMTFAFMIIPMVLINDFSWDLKELYKVYAPAMVFGVLAMAPAAIIAEKYGKFKEILMVGILLFAIAYLIIGTSSSDTIFAIGVVVFFIGFNMHEPIMQSLATKFAKVHQRGVVLGIFNSFGYLGTFLGGILGGIFFQSVSLQTIVITIAVVCLLWIVLIYTMPNPMKKKLLYIPLADVQREKAQSLHNIDAVDEWYINENEKLLIVKYDADHTNEGQIQEILK
ncbi:MAG: MFS transporter [Campylobacteraceae bacterium]|nr:MFS transporter [Campylobacteraceae bacterium]